MVYTLNLYNDICQTSLNKSEKKIPHVLTLTQVLGNYIFFIFFIFVSFQKCGKLYYCSDHSLSFPLEPLCYLLTSELDNVWPWPKFYYIE